MGSLHKYLTHENASQVQEPCPQCSKRNEAVTKYTVYSDAPAVDNGVEHAELFVGKESLVSGIYLMRSGMLES